MQIRILFIIATLLVPISGLTLGLRSMVAVPIAESDFVSRFMNDYTPRMDKVIFNGAYGLPNDGAIFFGVPYIVNPQPSNRLGNIGFLYRHMLIHKDRSDGTLWVGWLGGAIIPTADQRDTGVQAGLVATYFKDKDEVDANFIAINNFGNTPNRIRYDTSWQHRLLPATLPEWELPVLLQSVLEYNGRWMQYTNLVHQITAGLQIFSANLIIEGGVYKSLNSNHETGFVAGFRYRK